MPAPPYIATKPAVSTNDKGNSEKSHPITAVLRLILIGELFFQIFPKFGNNRKYVSIYGGVLSLFVKFSRRTEIIGELCFKNFLIYGGVFRAVFNHLPDCDDLLCK